MSLNLLDLVKNQLSGPLSSQAASYLNESESAVSKGLGAIIPSLLGSLVDKASDEKGASGILDMLTNQDDSILNSLQQNSSGSTEFLSGILGKGEGILSSLLGDKVGALASMVSNFSGLNSQSSSGLLKMAAPMLMGLVGKHVKQEGMNASGLMGLLSSQKEHLQGVLPDEAKGLLGLGSLGSLMGNVVEGASDVLDGAKSVGKSAIGKAGDLAESGVRGVSEIGGNLADAGKGAAQTTLETGKKIVGGAADLTEKTGKAAVNTGKSILKWLIPVLLILAVLGFLGIRTGCDSVDSAASSVSGTTEDLVGGAVDATKSVAEGAVEVAGDAAGAVGDAASSALEFSGDMLKGAFGAVNEAAKKAIEGVEYAAGSIGDQFSNFIDGGFEGENNFSFNELKFDTGSAEITAETALEVDQLAGLLKAYENVRVRIEGHTDNTGDAGKNKMLSQMRAEAIKARLNAQGVDSGRIETMGWGQEKPLADNSTEEGRAKNRRIEVRIVK